MISFLKKYDPCHFAKIYVLGICFFNGSYIDYLSFTYATNKNKILKVSL